MKVAATLFFGTLETVRWRQSKFLLLPLIASIEMNTKVRNSRGDLLRSANASMTKIIYVLKTFRKRIWFRALMYALVGVMTAVVGLFAGEWVPQSFVTKIGSDAVGNILSILASSMLAVSTFSLSIMVMAFGNVSTSATPRASRLLIENQNAQRAVATFIGAFLYGIVGIVALATSAYGEQGRFVLFIVTGVVILFIVVTLIRWVDQLSTLGQIGNTIAQIENATMATLTKRATCPHLGGQKIMPMISSEKINSKEVGFVAFINVEALQNVCEREQMQLRLELLPGSFVYPNRAIASCDRSLSLDIAGEIASHFVISPSRTFDQDPRLGFVLLSEIASRALSPGINDPGTAIEVIGAATRIFSKWSDLASNTPKEPVKYDRIFVPSLESSDFMEDLFGPLTRDGAPILEVGIKILRSLSCLALYDPNRFEKPSKLYGELLLERANEVLKTAHDKSLLEQFRPG